MAFMNIQPNSGSGNGTVQIGADNYTGRSNRTGTVRFQVNAGGNPFMDIAVTQLGVGDILEMTSEASFDLPSSGGSVVITGRSNLQTIRITNISGAGISSCSYKINSGNSQSASVETSIRITPSGDPGASGAYEFEITLTVGANTTIGEKISTINLTNGSSITRQITITQETANYLNVDPESLSFGAEGGTQSITIDTNESWTIE